MSKKAGFNTKKMGRGRKNNGLLTNALGQEIEFFQRHLTILKLVMTHEPVGIRGLSLIAGLPMHKVRYSLRGLENCGLIKATVKGAVTTGRLKRILPHLQKEINNTINVLMDVRENYEMNFNHTPKISADWAWAK